MHGASHIKIKKKFQVNLNLTRITATLYEDVFTFVEKIKTHILCSITFFPKSCRLWDNVGKFYGRMQATGENIIRRVRFGCRITKTADIHSEYVILIAFPRQQWCRERALVLR